MKAKLLTLFALFTAWPAAAAETPATASPVIYAQMWLDEPVYLLTLGVRLQD